MISSLRISNFALIGELNLQLNKGFSVITGETGSGKSILLGAFDLLIGERADFSLIGPLSDKAVVEATSYIAPYSLQDFFEKNDLDYSDEIIIRREINNSGRSRAFINDTPVQLTVLRELSSRLININSQYNTLELRDKEYQLELLDILSGLSSLRNELTSVFRKYKTTKSELFAKEEELSRLMKEKDFNLFQLNELESLNLKKSDYSILEKELSLAENGEQILNIMAFLINGLKEDGGLLEFLGKVKNELDRVKHIDQDLEDFYNRTNSVLIEMKEMIRDVEMYADTVSLNPEAKAILTEQLDKFNTALRKHNLKDQEGLIGLLESFSKDIEGTEKLEAEITYLQDDLRVLRSDLLQRSKDLHEKRKIGAREVESSLQSLLKELKLENTVFSFQLEEKDEPTANGISALNILFSANKGIDPVSIEKAASGGELSRVMLALQKLVSEKMAMPTVMFDEIDTGVSGDVAQKIGNLLKKMGENMQLIAITHLPQVAARAEHHYKVEKYQSDERTVSAVRYLNEEQHIEEVARLMSGEEITAAALNNARDLILS